MTSNTGRLGGIARHAKPHADIEVIEAAEVTREAGIEGDGRGALKGEPYKRQISLIEAGGFAAAREEAGAFVEWYAIRRNLLVEGLRLPREVGARVRIGESLVLEITDKCDPCQRMDGLHDGLRSALEPDWRCGFLAKVVEPGRIATGDPIRIES